MKWYLQGQVNFRLRCQWDPKASFQMMTSEGCSDASGRPKRWSDSSEVMQLINRTTGAKPKTSDSYFSSNSHPYWAPGPVCLALSLLTARLWSRRCDSPAVRGRPTQVRGLTREFSVSVSAGGQSQSHPGSHSSSSAFCFFVKLARMKKKIPFFSTC